MFIAMNRFRVVKGSEEAFENVWLSRDSYLDGNVPSFVEIGRAVAAVGVTTRLLVACQRSECLFSLIAR